MPNTGDRGASSTVGILLLVGVAIVLGATTIVLALTIVPSGGQDTSFTTSFEFDRVNGELRIRPNYISEQAAYDLLINGNEAYTWTDDSARRLSCLRAGDELKIVGDDPDAEGAYLLREYTVESRTFCSLSGAGNQFAYARVGDRKVPVADKQYEFSVSIDPRGPNKLHGSEEIPASNPWHFVKRYDRPVEGYEPPVYVIVFADNVGSCCGYGDLEDYSVQPEDPINVLDGYSIDSNGDITITAGGANSIEPTDDIWLVFKPGCDSSKFKYVGQATGYTENEIFLNGEKIIDDLNEVSEGDEFTTDGVECV
jgi:hypothetical protein